MAMRTLDLSRGRKSLKALANRGYDVVVQSVMQGISRVVDVADDDDWARLREQVATHDPTAWYGEDISKLLAAQDVASFALSYRHVHHQVRRRRGETMNEAQWGRLRDALLSFARVYKSSYCVLWIDQVLHCSRAMTASTNWVTKGVLPYLLFPVVYVGGPDADADDEHQRRLWVAIERAAALTNSGICMQGRPSGSNVLMGATLSLAPALRWLAGRILGGAFNACALSWERDYLTFRNLSVAIAEASEGIRALEGFLAAPDEKVERPKYTVMEAFIYAADSNDTSFSGNGHEFHGIYLASRQTKAARADGGWHGLREWVQYEWIDGKLEDGSSAELAQIIGLTRFYLFRDAVDGNCAYAIVLVSAQGEVGALGVAHLRNADATGRGTLLWFQRGLSPLCRQYARQLFCGMKPSTSLIREISSYWKISMGEPFGAFGGRHCNWKWSST